MPREGPVLLCPVHTSNVDPAAVGCSSPRVLHFMAKAELFRVPVFGSLIRSLGAFPLERGGLDSRALRAALARLDSGGALLVFPEGRRGDGDALLPLEKGVAALARRPGVQVVAVGVAGSRRMLPKGASRPRRARVTVVYGEPFGYDECPALPGEGHRESFLRRLAAEMAAVQAEAGEPFTGGVAETPGAAALREPSETGG